MLCGDSLRKHLRHHYVGGMRSKVGLRSGVKVVVVVLGSLFFAIQFKRMMSKGKYKDKQEKKYFNTNTRTPQYGGTTFLSLPVSSKSSLLLISNSLHPTFL